MDHGHCQHSSYSCLYNGNQISLHSNGWVSLGCQAYWLFHGRLFFHHIDILFYEGRTQCEEQHNIDVISYNCDVASILEVAIVVYLY